MTKNSSLHKRAECFSCCFSCCLAVDQFCSPEEGSRLTHQHPLFHHHPVQSSEYYLRYSQVFAHLRNSLSHCLPSHIHTKSVPTHWADLCRLPVIPNGLISGMVSYDLTPYFQSTILKLSSWNPMSIGFYSFTKVFSSRHLSTAALGRGGNASLCLVTDS
ncbi:hypothetical protein VTK73DRAFT_9709 [Phialemonium thermophilum]|uniref:Uncharacterized protein n=1 Tax=Phialemonium thermophilum TaxID=223376 RepID=A0ABR3XJR4_9PEZI